MLNHAIEIQEEKKNNRHSEDTHTHTKIENWIKLVSTYLFKHGNDSLIKHGFPP